MRDGASKGLISALDSEYFQLSEDKCSYVEKRAETLSRKYCLSQCPFLGTSQSLTVVSVPSAICQGALVDKGTTWQNGPSCTFDGTYYACPSAAFLICHHLAHHC